MRPLGEVVLPGGGLGPAKSLLQRGQNRRPDQAAQELLARHAAARPHVEADAVGRRRVCDRVREWAAFARVLHKARGSGRDRQGVHAVCGALQGGELAVCRVLGLEVFGSV